MEALLTSIAVVALAEIGDKTMLLAIVLAARFRKPLPIIAGILVATLANHFLAALAGAKAAEFFTGTAFHYLVAASFIVIGLWTLTPDKLEEDEADHKGAGLGPFLATTIAFFLVEIGDKTQLATIALGARYSDAVLVTMGTTIGMLAANVPAVILGEKLVERIPLSVIRAAAAILFVAIGLWLAASTAGWV
ncbi:MAG: TMEM165/GDT1 family protein [Novosphingobium sp.]|nr:TMEM165/GDT1 family protein [Novosphingobium sp.]